MEKLSNEKLISRLMEVMFFKTFPRVGGLLANISAIGSARVYWLTSGR